MCSEMKKGIEYKDSGEYEKFLVQIQNYFKKFKKEHLFLIEKIDLFKIYIESFPEEVKQIYNCNACKSFINKFGRLIVVTSNGKIISALWPDDVPDLFKLPVENMKKAILKSEIIGVFLSKEKTWGRPETGEWTHIAIKNPPVYFSGNFDIQSAGQAAAEKSEDFKTLNRSFEEFPLSVVKQAVKLLKTDSLYRSEKCLGIGEWFRDISEKRMHAQNSKMKDNLAWLAVAKAPSGFCHIKTSMIGTLLEDIVSGMDFDKISRRFAEKMHPLQYQRPSAPPSAGNIAQAEKIIEQMKASGSLMRRFARLDDIKSLWTPKEENQTFQGKEGIFSHLKTKDKKSKMYSVDIPIITMTWDKFSRTILPEAEQIEFKVPSGNSSFAGLVTAVNPEVPPILQWDTKEYRNPVSWYFYVSGSQAKHWNLKVGKYTKVTSICLKPSMWGKPVPQQGKGIFIILDEARDMNSSSLCLFPEMLKSEFRQIRSTIEAYSKSRNLEGAEEASACGFGLTDNGVWNDVVLRVYSKQEKIDYKLDRWD